MILKNRLNYFKSLVSETSKKSEIKIYQEFIQILTSLEQKNLSEHEIQSIEKELDNLDLESNPKNRKKYFKKAHSNFEKYLMETFSLTTKEYHTKLYGGLGLSFGLLFGVVFLSSLEHSLGISLGLIGGMVVGSIIGRSKDVQAKAAGNIL
jgi:hypothetical protein